MRRKVWMVGLAVVTVFAVVGVGYGALTASAFVNVNATAGNVGPLSFSGLSISFTGSPVTGQGCGIGLTTTTNPQDTMTLSGSLMSVGMACAVAATISNGGTWPGVITTSISNCMVNGGSAVPTNPSAGTFTCGDFTYADSTTSPTTIAGAGSVSYTADYGLSPSAPATAAGETVSFQITVTATAS